MKLKLFAIFLLFFFFNSCSDKPSPYYVVNKIRTPTMQFYSQTSQTGQGCISGLYDNNIWCQQYPIRPTGTVNAAASNKIKLRFLVLAPTGTTITLTLTSLAVFDMSLFSTSFGNGSRGINPSTPTTSIPLSDFSFNLNSSLSTVIQTTPMVVQSVVFDVAPPTLSQFISYAQTNQFLPGFVLNYTTSSSTQSYVDKGYFTFFLLPDSSDTSSWSTLTTSVSSFVSNRVLTQAQTLAKLNVPIQIASVSPSSGSTISASSNNNISGILTLNPNPNSYSPIQWYVSSGTIDKDNDRTLSTSWNPGQNGGASSVLVARDWVGGMDYKISNYTAQ